MHVHGSAFAANSVFHFMSRPIARAVAVAARKVRADEWRELRALSKPNHHVVIFPRERINDCGENRRHCKLTLVQQGLAYCRWPQRRRGAGSSQIKKKAAIAMAWLLRENFGQRRLRYRVGAS